MKALAFTTSNENSRLGYFRGNVIPFGMKCISSWKIDDETDKNDYFSGLLIMLVSFLGEK
jgi:hypothetical protein